GENFCVVVGLMFFSVERIEENRNNGFRPLVIKPVNRRLFALIITMAPVSRPNFPLDATKRITPARKQKGWKRGIPNIRKCLVEPSLFVCPVAIILTAADRST